jgi:hypothetical protein
LLAVPLASSLTGQSSLPGAPSLAAQTLGRLDAGTALHSIRLSGTVTGHFGAPLTGTVTLEASGPAQSRVEFDFPDGRRIELRGDDAHGRPWGSWSDASGTAHAMALANCWIPAVWFLPQFAVLMPGHADEVLSELAGADGSQRLQRVRDVAHQNVRVEAEIERLSTAVLSTDTATGLPVTLDYTLHPDKGAPTAIPVEIRYSDYRTEGGVQIPFHVEMWMQRALVYDIEIQNAGVNPELEGSDFGESATVANSYDQAPHPKGATR